MAAFASTIGVLRGRAYAQGQSAESRLKALGLTLPTPPAPIATYVPAVKVATCSSSPDTDPPPSPDGKTYAGKVGRDLTLEEGRAAARLVGLNVLASVRSSLGSLDRVVRVVKVLGMVNAVEGFTQQPQVVNGFSDLLVEIFGEERGKGAGAPWEWGRFPTTSPSK